jgi:hypothetical protein
MRYFMAGLIFWSACTALPAQWLKIKTPGIPRQSRWQTGADGPSPADAGRQTRSVGTVEYGG